MVPRASFTFGSKQCTRKAAELLLLNLWPQTIKDLRFVSAYFGEAVSSVIYSLNTSLHSVTLQK